MITESQDSRPDLLKETKETTLVGTPIEARNRTLIPIASAPAAPGWLERFRLRKPAEARPMGFLVLSDKHTRFVGVQDRRWLWLGIGLAVLSLILILAGVGLQRQKTPRRPALW